MARSKAFLTALALAGSVAALILLFGTRAHADPTDFNIVSTAAATTSPAYLTPGTATTTLTYDSLANGSNRAVLFTQFAASSTSSVLNVAVQYSQDGIDWYSDNLLASTNSTTTPTKSLQVPNTYSWTAVGTATSSKAIEVQTPSRFVRAQYSMTGASGAVWGQMVAQKQESR